MLDPLRGGNPARALAGGAVHFLAVPFVRGSDGPIGAFVSVAAVAGVGDVQFLGQQRIGNGEAVIVPGVALHINRHRHVAADALVAGVRAGGGMMGMFERDDDRGVGEAAVVAAQAEIVAGQKEFGANAGRGNPRQRTPRWLILLPRKEANS